MARQMLYVRTRIGWRLRLAKLPSTQSLLFHPPPYPQPTSMLSVFVAGLSPFIPNTHVGTGDLTLLKANATWNAQPISRVD